MMTDVLEEWIKRIGAAAGAITAILMLIPRTREVILTPFHNWRRRARQRNEVIEKLIQIGPRLSKVADMIEPNGGSAIPDAIARLEKRLEQVFQQNVDLKKSTEAIQFQLHYQTELQAGNFDLYPNPLLLYNATGECIGVNRSWCELTGMRPEDATGSGWEAGIYHEDIEKVITNFMSAIRDRRAFNLVHRVNNGDRRSTTYVRSIGRPLRAKDGTLLGYMRLLEIIGTRSESLT